MLLKNQVSVHIPAWFWLFARLFIALDGPFFVTQRPENYAWMIPVADHKAFQQIEVFLVYSHKPVLIEDQHSKTVANIEQVRCWRILRCTDCMCAPFLEFFYPEFLQGIRNGNTNACMVLVLVHSFDFHVFSVQEESQVGVEADSPYAYWCQVIINYFSAFNNFSLKGIQVWLFD